MPVKTLWTVTLWAGALLLFICLYTYDPLDISYNTTHTNFPVNNSAGILGAWIAFFLFFSFGYAAYAVVFTLFFAGCLLFSRRRDEASTHNEILRGSAAFFMVIALAVVFQLPAGYPLAEHARNLNIVGPGGIVGEFICVKLTIPYLGIGGSTVLAVVIVILSLVVFTRINLLHLLGKLTKRLSTGIHSSAKQGAEILHHKRRTVPLGTQKVKVKQYQPRRRRVRKTKIVVTPPREVQGELELVTPSRAVKPRQKPSRKKKPRFTVSRRGGRYMLPPVDLLKENVPSRGRQVEEDLQRNVDVLESTLKEFGIDADVGNVIRGPVITRYEVHPAPGVKVQKITALADDIALAMAASSIRIVAPIPGKSAVGIEIPNSKATLVGLKEMLIAKEFKKKKDGLPLAIGKEISGTPVVGDLTKMPHLLIAGATGSGKTVCINSMILSMLYSRIPSELQMVLIDPKRVEMTQFRDIPHLLTPVVTEAKTAVKILCWACREMERRYDLFSGQLVRNILGYNEKVARKGKETVDDEGNPLEPLPYLVIIIDELADLMLTARKDIEDPIIRLAQMGRAAGLHLILATQRPSVNVITGIIKANFPARIAFKVATTVDSKVILDTSGAEKLLGMGDMLFIPPGTSRRLRVQGTLVSDEEINEVVAFIKDQAQPEYREDILSFEEEGGGSAYDEVDDSLYDEAVSMVRQMGQASASMLQRRMRIGYARAGRLIDMMEERGIVGPSQGSKPREVIG